MFFDFDDGGPGYLAYDLAVFLWCCVSFGRKQHAFWHTFIEGYRTIRDVPPVDFAAVPFFVPIRHIWLMGEYAGRTHEWGSQAAPAEWIATQLEFMWRGKQRELVPGLF